MVLWKNIGVKQQKGIWRSEHSYSENLSGANPEGLPGLVHGYILHMAAVLTHQNIFLILIFECFCMGYQIDNVPSFSNNNVRRSTLLFA